MNRRQRIAATRHVKDRRARRRKVAAMKASIVAMVARELEHELREGLLYGCGPFAMKPGPTWHGAGLADLLFQHPKEPRP